MSRTLASKIARKRWNLRARCEQWHTVYKRWARPTDEYACPYCDADVR